MLSISCPASSYPARPGRWRGKAALERRRRFPSSESSSRALERGDLCAGTRPACVCVALSPVPRLLSRRLEPEMASGAILVGAHIELAQHWTRSPTITVEAWTNAGKPVWTCLVIKLPNNVAYKGDQHQWRTILSRYAGPSTRHGNLNSREVQLEDDSEAGGGAAVGESPDSFPPAHAIASADCEVPVESFPGAAREAGWPQPGPAHQGALLAQPGGGGCVMYRGSFKLRTRKQLERLSMVKISPKICQNLSFFGFWFICKKVPFVAAIVHVMFAAKRWHSWCCLWTVNVRVGAKHYEHFVNWSAACYLHFWLRLKEVEVFWQLQGVWWNLKAVHTGGK